MLQKTKVCRYCKGKGTTFSTIIVKEEKDGKIIQIKTVEETDCRTCNGTGVIRIRE